MAASTTLSNLQILENAVQESLEKLKSRNTAAHEWLLRHADGLQSLKLKSQQAVAAATIVGGLALAQPVDLQVREQFAQQSNSAALLITQQEYDLVLQKLQAATQLPVGHLPEDDELYLEQQLSDILGFVVTAELDGHRLNHSIGIMGSEQHLRRYPTDNIDQHDAYREAGMAPNRGAFGWFTQDGRLTEQDRLREKYYFVVQTMYLPDWNSNHAQLKPWYKFRKMIMVNPAEKLAVVGVVGDAGPAAWVQKQFGGSPEVIREGKVWSPQSHGRVILLFVDDPNDTVPLGPIDLDSLLNNNPAVQVAVDR